MSWRIVNAPVLLKSIVLVISLLPLLSIVGQLLSGHFGPDPAKKLALASGHWSIRFLMLSLLVSSVARLAPAMRGLLVCRRMIGLFAFFYLSLHLLVFIALFLGFDTGLLVSELHKRPYITAGFAGWLLLLPLAITSNNWFVRKLGGQRWKSLHRASYLALGLGVIHVIWQVRSDWGPALAYSALAAGLIAERAGFYRQAREG